MLNHKSLLAAASAWMLLAGIAAVVPTTASAATTPPSRHDSVSGSSAKAPANKIVARRGTKVVRPADILGVLGAAGHRQTVLTDATRKALPKVGGYLVSAPSAHAPNGVFGRVVKIARASQNRIVVSLMPAALSDAYEEIRLHVSTKVQANQVKALPASPTRAAKVPGLNFNLARAAFTCDSSNGTSLALNADLTDFTVDFTLDKNPLHPQVGVKLTVKPKISLTFKITGELSCTLSAGRILGVTIPVPAFPALQVVVKPVFTIDATAEESVGITWQPTVITGFTATQHGIAPVNSFNAGSLSPSGDATANSHVFFGLSLALTLAGRAGVTGDFGPYLDLSYTGSDDCFSVIGGLELNLTATVDVFIAKFTQPLLSKVFGRHTLYTNCTTPSIATKSLPSAQVGSPYTTLLTTDDHRTGTWSIVSGSLPAGLALRGYTISGKPTTAGSARFTVRFTDTHRKTTDAVEVIGVFPAPTPGGGTSGGGGASPGAKVDIVFAIDTTGSMSPYINAAINSASAVVDSLDSSHVNYQVGVVDYKDADFGCGDYASTIDLPFSSSRTSILGGISSLASKVYGGCDLPEDVYSGINTALSFPWRNGAKKSVIVLGDAPGHDPEPLSGLTLAKVAAHAAAVDPAQVYPVLVGDDSDAHAFDQALADATGGKTFDATDDPASVGTALVQAIGTIVTGGDTVLKSVSGNLSQSFSAALVAGDGTPLANRVIDFTVPAPSGTVSICSALTGADGVGSCSPDPTSKSSVLFALLTTGSSFVASYAGSDEESPSSLGAKAIL